MPVMQSNSASEASSLSPSSTIPKFLLKPWSLVNDEATQGIVEWSDDGSCFLIRYFLIHLFCFLSNKLYKYSCFVVKLKITQSSTFLNEQGSNFFCSIVKHRLRHKSVEDYERKLFRESIHSYS